MFQDMLGSIFGGGDRRKKFMDMAQGAMKNPDAMKAIGAMAGGMGGGEGAAGAEGGGGLASILGGGMKRPELGPGGTGGFAGNEGLPKIGRPMGGDTGLINRPEPMPTQMPMLKRPDAPTFEPIRDSADTVSQLPAGQLSVTPQQTQMIAPRPIAPVRPPDLLGRRGSTLEDTPMSHERYGYQTEYMNEGKVPRRWQDILANTLHGANQGFQQTGDWAGALGGAAAGGAGSAIDPTRARNFRFDQEQKPRLEAQRADLERGQDRSFELKKRGTDIAGTEARTQATIAGTKDIELERKAKMAQIAKTQAQEEAIRLGRLTQKDILDEDGVIRTYNFYPGRAPEVVGGSAKAAMNTQNIESREGIADKQIGSREKIAGQQIGSREKIVGIQQRGATGRTGMTQAGADRRQKERLGAQYGSEAPNTIPYGPDIPPQGKRAPAVGSVPVKRATSGDVNEYAKMKGISPAEARKKFEAKGYRVE